MSDQVSKDEKYDAIAAIGDLGSDDPADDPDWSETERRLVRQVNENKKIEKRIAALGIELTGVGKEHLEFTIEWLINNALSRAQREELALAWAERYGNILSKMEGPAREYKIAADRARVGAPPAGLIVPPGLRRPDRG